jgi:hypothetical protein
VCVDSSSQCKDYKVTNYRWVEDGYCYKSCTTGSCEEGFCRRAAKFQEDRTQSQLATGYKEYEHPKAEETGIGLSTLLLLTSALFFFIFFFSMKMKTQEEIY